VLDAAAKLGKIIVGMNRALGDIPVTVKLRTGVKDGRNTAHKLMPRLGPEFGAGCITVRYFTSFRVSRTSVTIF
jgi:tRNA-dihydrouridine synthase 3